MLHDDDVAHAIVDRKGFKADVTVTTVDFTIWHSNGAVSSDD